MAEHVQEQQLVELSFSNTIYTADETPAPAAAATSHVGTEPTYRRSGIAALRFHNNGSSGCEVSEWSASGHSGQTAAKSPSTGLLSSLPSARALARSKAAESDGAGNRAPFPFRSFECDFRFRNGQGPTDIPRLTESGCELELENSVKATESSKSHCLPLGYLGTVPFGEEERLLNRDKSNEVLPQPKKRWSSWIYSW